MKLPFRSSKKPTGPSGSTPAGAVALAGQPDAGLARAAQCGDKRAFVEIVARHQALVCGVAYGILADFAASEDAAQEAFLTAWRRIHDLRDPGQLRPWLCRIVRNAALGQLRRRHPERSLDEALDAADPSLHPDEAAASGEEAALVRDALTKLPETFRMPLVLFYREGQSVKSVAEALELSEDAVKQRLARGREMLRERMSGLIEDVLTRTRPTAVFTMLIAGAIGALTAPSVVAGTAFAAAAAGTSAASTTTTAVTAMSTSKATLVTAAIVAVACLPLGYGARIGMETRPENKGAAISTATDSKAAPPAAKTDFSASPLYAEWRQLHDEHGSDAGAMPALYKAIGAIKDPVRRRVFRAAQIAEWAEIDPGAGLAYFLEKGRDYGQRNQFFDEWMRRDSAAAVDALLAAGPAGHSLARRSLTEIAKRVPGKLAEVVSRLPKPEGYWASEVRDAFAILAGGELSNARAAAEALTGPNREAALTGVAKVWAKTDPDAAIAWARALPDGTNRDEIIRGALTGLAAVNARAALDLISSVPPGGRDGYFATTTGARVLSEAAAADYDATVAWLKQHPVLNQDDLMGIANAVTDRINADPRGFLEKHAADGSLSALMPAVSSALLNQGSGQCAAVWEWIKSRPADPALAGLRQQVINATAYQDPFAAIKLAADFGADSEGETDIRMLASSLLNGGQRLGSFDQLYAAAPDRLKQSLADTAIIQLRSDNLDDAQRWLTVASTAPKGQEPAWTARVVSAWAGKEPEEAVAWIEALPDGDVRSASLTAAASAWIEKDAYAASAWLDRLPAGREKEQAAATLVANIARDAPPEAWEWAMSISDPDARVNAAGLVLDVLARRDPAQALQWLESSSLPPARKEAMSEFIRQGANGSRPSGNSGSLPAPAHTIGPR